MRPRLLWVTDEVPDAGRGGGSIRQYHLLRRVAAQVDVDLLLAGEPVDDELVSLLHKVETFERPPALGAHWNSAGRLSLARRRMNNLGSFLPGRPPSEVAINRPAVEGLRNHLVGKSGYDVVQVEHEHLAGVLPRDHEDRWSITLHNLMSVRFRQRSAVAGTSRVRRLWEADARRAETWERRILAGYDLTIVVSDEDAACLNGNVAVVPNGVDLERFQPTPLPREPRLMFSGSFNYEPNIDGATWLCQEILPQIRERVPGATAVLVGREPDDRVRRLGRIPGVETHFDVPDVRPFLQSARVAMVPLRQGSGTRLKALEAMAAGRPLAGTPVGLEGLGLSDGDSAVIGTTIEEIADRVAQLLIDDTAAGSVARQARRLVEDRFGWDHLAEVYLDKVLGRPVPVKAG